MKGLLIISFILIFILLVIVFAKATITVLYTHEHDDDLLELKAYIWKINIYTYTAPLIKMNKQATELEIKETHSTNVTSTQTEQKITIQKIMNQMRSAREIL